MSRAFIIMLDSFGIGAAPDAAHYGDVGADTLRHIATSSALEKPLAIPHLTRLGINAAAKISQGEAIAELGEPAQFEGAYGCASEMSLGKDTQSGHWEMAGVPVLFEWGYFKGEPAFPHELLEALIQQAGLPGVLGNKHASGTTIIDELGEEHQKTGKPIVYTSADSVFQIAAHETSFGLERLYRVSEIARKLVDAYHIGRVIARPFLGTPGHYHRTGNRHDYAVPPHAPTLLDMIVQEKGQVIAIGKVADIYANHGISKSVRADGNVALFDTFLKESKTAPDHSLTFVNLVDFDMLYGHRRDVVGYAKALEQFDRALPAFMDCLKPGDMAVITGDHGCDPTWPGSDHTRENVPILAFGPAVKPGSLGLRNSFADIGQSIAHHLGLPSLPYGQTFV
jgi:phosphopentomutase